MSKKNENVNPEIAMAKGISDEADEASEAISNAMLDLNDNAGIESSSNYPSDAPIGDNEKPPASIAPLQKGVKTNSAIDTVNVAPTSKIANDEKLVELFVSNPEADDGTYFTLSINLKEFKIEFNKPCMVPEYVRDFYYSLNKDIALNNKKQNAFADKNPA